MATLEEIQKAGGYFTPLASVPSPQTTATTLVGGVSPMNVAPTPVDSTNYPSIISEQIASLPQINQDVKQAETKTQDSTSILNSLLMGQAQIPTASQDQSVIDSQLKVDQYNTQQAQLNAQASTLNREAQAIPLQAQQGATGQGITDRGLAPITTAQLRDNAIKALSIAQQSDINQAALTGSQIALENARNRAQQIVDLKYKAYETAIKVEQQNYLQNKDFLERVDKKKADALGLAIKKEEQALAERKANEKEVSKLIVDASQVAPQDVLQKAKDIQAKGGTAAEVAMALGKYGGDYLANEKLKLEMKKIKNDMYIASQKASAEQATIQTPEVAGWVKNINEGKAKLSDVPQKLKSAVSLGLSSATSVGNPAKLEDYRNKLTLVDEVLNSGALSAVVGPSPFGRVGYAYNRATGEMQDFTAKVNQLTEGLTLQSLIDAKSKGATFGALSEGELNLLAKSATRLNSYKKLDDNGNIYYDVNESGFKSALKEIKDLTQKSYEREGGSNFVTTGNSVVDQFVKQSIPALQSSQSTTLMQQGGYK